MIRIYVTVDESEVDKHGSLRSTICPYCFADIYFDEVSPVYCYKCKEELEPYSDIEKNLDKRVEYYRSKHSSSKRGTLCFG